jgi:hypothetical protein
MNKTSKGPVTCGNLINLKKNLLESELSGGSFSGYPAAKAAGPFDINIVRL